MGQIILILLASLQLYGKETDSNLKVATLCRNLALTSKFFLLLICLYLYFCEVSNTLILSFAFGKLRSLKHHRF